MLTTQQHDDAVVARWDDGGVNAVNHDTLAGLGRTLDDAVEAELPLVILGRDRILSSGFDLKIFEQGMKATADLVEAGARLLHRMVSAPVPVIIGSTGHAVAMGALLLMAADRRVGVDGRFKVGLNEVAIGMGLPRFAVTLAEDRLSTRHLLAATAFARVYTPSEAVDAGYLDAVVDAGELETAVMAEAAAAAKLHRGAFAATKARVRGPLADKLDAAIFADRTDLAGE